jgi:thiamine transport system permease protein
VEAIGALPLVASPLVLGTGLIVLALPFGDPTRWAVPVTALVNALMALPFALRILLPAWRRAEEDYGRLAESLGMPPGARLRRVVLRAIRGPLGFAAGLAAALAMGDLGVIALFAGPEVATLPLAMYRLIAAYRMGDAAGAALVLLALSLALFYAFDRGGRADART